MQTKTQIVITVENFQQKEIRKIMSDVADRIVFGLESGHIETNEISVAHFECSHVDFSKIEDYVPFVVTMQVQPRIEMLNGKLCQIFPSQMDNI